MSMKCVDENLDMLENGLKKYYDLAAMGPPLEL